MDIHIIHRRLEPESDHVKTVRIIHCALRTCTRFASFPTLAFFETILFHFTLLFTFLFFSSWEEERE